MLRIEVDMFSGRPNPTWIITDEDQAKQLLEAAASERGALAKPGSGFGGLGLREIRVETLADEGSRVRGVPAEFAVSSFGSADVAAADRKVSGALARRLIETMPLRSKIRLVEHELTPLDAKLRDLILERIDRDIFKPWKPPVVRPTANPLIDTTQDAKCRKCEYEISQFNPAFWNNPATQPYNNCYNYGRNWKTNTFAQPGRAHGAMTSTMACNTVTTAAMADGLVKRCNPCLPSGEFPRRLMALVIDPGWDYHWYRHQRGGFWGHKPGSTPAKNTDNSNVVITNPETCNRGGYTDFCGYFYAGKSVVIN
jgi:hypothetical protein